MTTATFVINLNNVPNSDNYHLSAEIDTRKGGENAQNLGKIENFLKGERVAFLVYATDNIDVSKLDVRSSDGSISPTGRTFLIEQKQQFQISGDEDSLSLNKPLKTITSRRWFGNNLEQLLHGIEFNESNTQIELKKIDTPANKLKNTTPAIVEFVYTSTAHLFYLNLPSTDEKDYPVLVRVAYNESES